MFTTATGQTIARRTPALAAALLAFLWVVPAEADYSEFTVMQEVASRDLKPFTKWTGVQKRFKTQLKSFEKKACASDACPLAQWKTMLKEAANKSARDKLDAVNDFFAKVKYVEDRDNYGKGDYWATPFEMMARGGDCEDYAIAKYLALKQLGIAETDMRIMIVQDHNLGGIMHAVLEVKLDGAKYLLDNQASTVVEETAVHHYRPIYAVNGREWWAFKG